MKSSARTSAELTEFHARHLAGRVVSEVVIHGINSLKSLEVPLSALEGSAIGALTPTTDSSFSLQIGGVVVSVDLQRTGSVVFLPEIERWRPGKPSMPTGQIFFVDGGGLNFVEPAKTKRITFSLRAK